jgi:hypothetical protein
MVVIVAIIIDIMVVVIITIVIVIITAVVVAIATIVMVITSLLHYGHSWTIGRVATSPFTACKSGLSVKK